MATDAGLDKMGEYIRNRGGSLPIRKVKVTQRFTSVHTILIVRVCNMDSVSRECRQVNFKLGLERFFMLEVPVPVMRVIFHALLMVKRLL